MPLDSVVLPLITLLHILVLVYWLGGDLGAFYASSIVLNPREPPTSRIFAARIIGAVDMAPRTALILAFPTGLLLAKTQGWVEPAVGVMIGSCVVCLVWLALVWGNHLWGLPAHSFARQCDIVVRWVALLLLLAAALGWFAPFGPLPAFLQWKCALLAAAIGCGLVIRHLLAPFAPALQALSETGASAAINADLARSLGRARGVVMVIWCLLVCSAAIGVWRPG